MCYIGNEDGATHKTDKNPPCLPLNLFIPGGEDTQQTNKKYYSRW